MSAILVYLLMATAPASGEVTKLFDVLTSKPTDAPTSAPTSRLPAAPTDKPTDAPTEDPTDKRTDASTTKPTTTQSTTAASTTTKKPSFSCPTQTSNESYKNPDDCSTFYMEFLIYL